MPILLQKSQSTISRQKTKQVEIAGYRRQARSDVAVSHHRAMREVLTCLLESRIYGSEKLRSTVQKTLQHNLPIANNSRT